MEDSIFFGTVGPWGAQANFFLIFPRVLGKMRKLHPVLQFQGCGYRMK